MAAGEGARKPVSAEPQVSKTARHGAPEIRLCQGLDELKACVALQKEVWNFDDLDLIPLRMFVVAENSGGQVVGAFDRGELVGFAMSIPGIRCGKPYLHSDMLAVRESYRNAGIGRHLKVFQRSDALQRGIELIEWTFDPLEIKNAWLNIERLGVIVRRYHPNRYGYSSSPLQGGLPTDRLVAEWWLRSRRVETLLVSGQHPSVNPELRVEVPAHVYAWKASAEHREKAKDVQSRNRELFLDAFRHGMAVLGFERDAGGNGAFLLGKWDEDWGYGAE